MTLISIPSPSSKSLSNSKRKIGQTIRWVAAGGGEWDDATCWDAGRPPNANERACFEIPVSGRVLINSIALVGQVAVNIGTTNKRVTLGGTGKLILSGVDRFMGKPVSMQVENGTLLLADPLRVEVTSPRFSANAGGRLIIATSYVRAVGADLKLHVSQTGVLSLRTENWSPGFDLDVSSSRSQGLGPRIIDFGHALRSTARQVTFRLLKEHDGEEILIRGFQPGDQLRFQHDPTQSTDPGKPLRLNAVTFPGAANDGKARLVRSGGYYYLLPIDPDFSTPDPEWPSQKSVRPTIPVQIEPPTPITTSGVSADVTSLYTNTLVAAIESINKVAISVSAGDGSGWSPALELDPPPGVLHAASPNLLLLRSGEILLVYQAILHTGEISIAMTGCSDPTRAGSPEAWRPSQILTDLQPNLLIKNGRLLQQSNGTLLLPFTLNCLAGCLQSTNDGATWSRFGEMIGGGPEVRLQCPAVGEIEPRHLFMLSATNMGRIYRSESRDGANQWSSPTEVTNLVSPAAPFALTVNSDCAEALIVWNHQSRRKDDGEDRIRLSVSSSTDNGYHWSTPHLLTANSSEISTYPSLTSEVNKTGSFIATYLRLSQSDGIDSGCLQSVRIIRRA